MAPRIITALTVVALLLVVPGCTQGNQPTDNYFQLEVHAYGLGWGPHFRVRVDSEHITVDESVGWSLQRMGTIQLEPEEASQLRRETMRIRMPQSDTHYRNPDVDDGGGIALALRSEPADWPTVISADNCRLPGTEGLILLLANLIQDHEFDEQVYQVLAGHVRDVPFNPVCTNQMLAAQE